MSKSSNVASEMLLSIFSLGDYAPTLEGFAQAKEDVATNELTIPTAHFGSVSNAIFETADKLGGEQVAIAIISNGEAISIGTRPEPEAESMPAKMARLREEMRTRNALNNAFQQG